MFSVAVSLFNVELMDFQWEPALNNFLEFGDELVVNVNQSEDNTQDLIVDWGAEIAEKRPEKPIIISLSEFGYDDPQLDGKCKNNAVQNCTHQFIVLVDIDERLLASQRPQWERLALDYIQKDQCDAILIPSVNLFGSEEKAKNINQKWYLHRQGITRGVVNFARKKDGIFDIEKSDGTEPLVDKEGNLARSLAVVPPQISDYEKLSLIKQNNLPYVLHLGYVDFDKRIKRSQTFWENQWKLASGRETVDVPLDKVTLENTPTFEHGLKLRDEVKELENVQEPP